LLIETFRYAHADFALWKGLNGSLEHLRLLYTYDVACQHFVNLLNRMAKVVGPETLEKLKEIVPRLPAWHGDAHVWWCRDRFCLKYTPGVGMTHGETVEHVWHVMNPVGLSTREMNPGHRKDKIDAHLGLWNEQKGERLGECSSWLSGERERTHTVGTSSRFLGC
jgi:hypothetical protein